MKKLPLFCLLLAVIAVPLLVLAQAEPLADPGSIITGILTAFSGKKWAVLVGLLLTGIVYVIRTYFLAGWKWAQTSRGGAIVAIGIAVIGTLGAELAAGILSVGSILDALMAAIMSAGGFNLISKLFVPAKPTSGPPA